MLLKSKVNETLANTTHFLSLIISQLRRVICNQIIQVIGFDYDKTDLFYLKKKK